MTIQNKEQAGAFDQLEQRVERYWDERSEAFSKSGGANWSAATGPNGRPCSGKSCRRDPCASSTSVPGRVSSPSYWPCRART